jgi:hypothetical protein
VTGPPGGAAHDLIDEFWFDRKEDAVAFWHSYRGAEDMARQDAEHIARERTWVVFAREHEVFGPLPE